MQFHIDQLTTPDLLKLEVEYRKPEDMKTACALRGVEAELLSRSTANTHEALISEAADLRDKLRNAEEEIESLEEAASDALDAARTSTEQIRQLTAELATASAKIAELEARA